MLDKFADHRQFEARLYDAWEKGGVFSPGQGAGSTFCCALPPPNVTGDLHMGHALNVTIQDVVCRFHRMMGRDVLWQPGTDHAGIATQMVVERQLSREGGMQRREMGRSAFLRRVWEWKEESGGAIITQLRRLGASCDWSRTRFTMDEAMSRAVVKAFVALYRDGLIYKDKRLVNWDPKLLTAISDLEVEQVEVKGHFFYLRYPIEGESEKFLIVATTRPETIFGDVAVAVHPEDERYAALVGKRVVLPLIGRRIPIIADTYSDPNKGTGAVKITPAHDFNDFEVGKRHGLEAINVFDKFGCLSLKENAAFLKETDLSADVLSWHGFDRTVARGCVVEALEHQGLLEKVEDHIHLVPVGDRSQERIEPWLTDQWYVDAAALASAASESVVAGRTVFIPKSWESTYFDWLKGIQPWCISRQLWWGHRIPAWYGPPHPAEGRSDCSDQPVQKIFVAETEAEILVQARAFYPADSQIILASDEDESSVDGRIGNCLNGVVVLRRDNDVLDTWFSSSLWPFSTLGWPDETPELKRFYPTNMVVTGFDIIFFWVARMMMMGLHFTKSEPFKTVYIHALVRDEKGQKMSKSKGNVIDPLSLIEEYGADVLRFTLISMAAQGRDIRLSTGRVEGYRNFATKLWNAARFAVMNGCLPQSDFNPATCQTVLGRWIIGEVERLASSVICALESHRYNEAAMAVYNFVWHVFCDWYLEFAKPILNGDAETSKAEVRFVTAFVFDRIMFLLHPFMPFITEELWLRIGEIGGRKRGQMLASSRWEPLSGLSDKSADEEIGWVINVITGIRSVRAAINVPASAGVPLSIVSVSEDVHLRSHLHEVTLKRLAKLSSIDFPNEPPQGTVQFMVGSDVICLHLLGIIDFSAEKVRLKREISRATAEILDVDSKMANESFLSRAPEHIIEAQRVRRAEAETLCKKLNEALGQIERAITL